jgi:NADH:ubiquinone reductase (H+-translocating)
MTNDTIKYEVVIAGGGFAGVYAARSIARELGKSALSRVAIIADHNYMVFQPMLAEVTGSSISPRHVVNAIRRLCRDVSVLRGTIQSINLREKTLTLNAGHFTPNVTVEFEHVGLALGSVVDLSRVPGMPEHAFLMKTVGDAMELRGSLIDRLEEVNVQTDPASIQRLLTFVVVGGGYSGVETAGQMMDLLRGVEKFYPRVRQSGFRVILIHGGPVLLPEISERLGRYCEDNLRQRGVEVLLNSRVTAMTASKVFLQNGSSIETNTVVSTVGNAPHPLILQLENDLELARGRIVVDQNLRARNHDRVWAAGDCAAVPSPEDGLCPPTAQFAYHQGLLLGGNIGRAITAKPLKAFTYKGIGELASIGHRSAVAEIFGLKFSGFAAWFLWRTIYLLKLPGLERKLRVVIDWTLDLFFPRDITLLRPRPTEVLQEIHLEKGDVIFQPGEPALSFYIVKEGRIDLFDENGLVKSIFSGGHFGERALLHDRVWRFKAVAAEPSTLVALDANTFIIISRASRSIQRFFEHSAAQYATRKEIEELVKAMPEQVRSLRAQDLMSRNLITMNPDMTVGEALQLMTQHPYNSFPLVGTDGTTHGVIVQNDLYDALKRGLVNQSTTLSKIQPTPYPTILPDTAIPEAVERFCRSGRHKLLVIDDAQRLRGILTPMDLLAGRKDDGQL